MSFAKPSAGIGLENLWRDLNVLLERWPDKEHQYYKDLYNLLEDYSTAPDRETRLPGPGTRPSQGSGSHVLGQPHPRGYDLESWMESLTGDALKNMIVKEVYLILNGTDPEDKFLRENDPAEAVEDRFQFAATAAEEAAVINQQINAQGADEYGMVMALSTDQAHWEEYGIRTGEDLAKEMLLSSYSDLYKSFHGFRPRGGVSRDMSVEELNQVLDDLENYITSMQNDEPAVDEPEAHDMQGDASADPQGDYEEYDSMPQQVPMRRSGS